MQEKSEGLPINSRTYEEILDDPKLSAETKGCQCMGVYLSKDNSFVTDIFLGQFRYYKILFTYLSISEKS